MSAKTSFRRLYFDIETSPNLVLSWGVGPKINLSHDNIVKERAIICICYKWENEKTVHYLTWDNKQNDKQMLEKFIKVMNTASETVGHNSNRYDIKWVKTRCLYHRIPCFPEYQSLDTLQLARTGFRFNSNRLDYIGQFLGFGGKMDTTYGLWKDIVLNRSKRALADMVNYCQRDVLLLQKIHQTLKSYTKHKTHAGVLNGGHPWDCPECGSEDTFCSKTRTTAAGSVRRQMKCHTCNQTYTISNTAYQNKKDQSGNNS